MAKHYQIWVTCEEYDGPDSKVCDLETTLIGKTESEDDARYLFDFVSTLGLTVKDNTSHVVKLIV